jgi:hypothetical protein
MFAQTIALFRYQMLALINRKNLIVLCTIFLLGFSLGQFSGELAIINSQAVATGVLAEFLRYSLIIFFAITICHQISQDYELGQFDRLLAMPIARWQYVFARLLVVISFALLLSLPILPLFIFTAQSQAAVYWTVAVFLELILVGLISMLATLSLEKLPPAIVFTIAMYLFSRLVPLINYIFNQSAMYYEDEKGFQLGNLTITLIQFVLPDMTVFAQNNALFETAQVSSILFHQVLSLGGYGFFIVMVILLDFYRKEIRS